MCALSNLGMGSCRPCQPLRGAPPAPLLSWWGRARLQSAPAASAGYWGCSGAVQRACQARSPRQGQWGCTLQPGHLPDAWNATVSGPRPLQPVRLEGPFWLRLQSPAALR